MRVRMLLAFAVAMSPAVPGAAQSKKDFDALTRRIVGLEKANKDLSVLLQGVVAFNRSQNDACPPGWRLFEAAGGRFVIGAGTHSNTDMNGAALTNYPPFKDLPKAAVGGEERHVLALSELPKHKPKILAADGKGKEAFLGQFIQKLQTCEGGGCYDNGTITDMNAKPTTDPRPILEMAEIGENAPHNNMPPFVALYYCIKK